MSLTLIFSQIRGRWRKLLLKLRASIQAVKVVGCVLLALVGMLLGTDAARPAAPRQTLDPLITAPGYEAVAMVVVIRMPGYRPRPPS